jgi:chaperonin cofactor prefoldin
MPREYLFNLVRQAGWRRRDLRLQEANEIGRVIAETLRRDYEDRAGGVRALERRVDELEKTLQARVERLETRQQALSDSLDRLSTLDDQQSLVADEVERQGHKLNDASAELHRLLYGNTIEVDFSRARGDQYIPVRVYIADRDVDTEQVQTAVTAVERVLTGEGFERVDELPAEYGSWWGGFWHKLGGVFTREDVQKKLLKVEEGLETQLISKPQSEANLNNANAAKAALEGLAPFKNGCIQVGPLLVVKLTPPNGDAAVTARILTFSELRRLEENPLILQNPERVLTLLAEAVAASLRSGKSDSPSAELPPQQA